MTTLASTIIRRAAPLAALTALLSAGPASASGQATAPRAAREGRGAPATSAQRQARQREVSDSVIETALLARRMAQYGRTARSALALAAAAQILLDNPPRPLDDSTTSDTTRPAEGPGRDFDPRSLLAEARALAGADQAVVALVAQLEQRAESQGRGRPRGTVSGPRQRYGHLTPGARHTYRISFAGEQSAVVYVSGDGGIPLELAVYGPGGARVAFDRGTNEKSIVQWRPPRSTRFVVQVRNRGPEPTWYVLLTN